MLWRAIVFSKMSGGATAPLVALIELAASERPQLLDLQLDTVLNSPMRFAAHNLASDFGVPVDQIGVTISRACHHLDRLEKRRGHWRDPSAILESPNVAALLQVCEARLEHVSGKQRQRRLEAILRKLEQAHERARTRAWIEAFLDPPFVEKLEAASGVDR